LGADAVLGLDGGGVGRGVGRFLFFGLLTGDAGFEAAGPGDFLSCLPAVAGCWLVDGFETAADCGTVTICLHAGQRICLPALSSRAWSTWPLGQRNLMGIGGEIPNSKFQIPNSKFQMTNNKQIQNSKSQTSQRDENHPVEV
jgi:hypothetical protein